MMKVAQSSQGAAQGHSYNPDIAPGMPQRLELVSSVGYSIVSDMGEK